jgi:hypothetical protein
VFKFNRKPVLLVTITWPAGGGETYRFKDKAAQEGFVDGCINAADLGHPFLADASYLLHPAHKPFDPRDLLEETCSRKSGPWHTIVATVSLRRLASTDWCIDAKTGLRGFVATAVYSLPWV